MIANSQSRKEKSLLIQGVNFCTFCSSWVGALTSRILFCLLDKKSLTDTFCPISYLHVCVSDVEYKKRSEGKLPGYYLKTKCLKPALHDNFFGTVPV